jgi:N6-adenosine-specific RNA methylase IME4
MAEEGDNRIGYWAERIARVWQDSVEGILNSGQNLTDARQELKENERPFSDLVGDKDGKPSRLPFNHTVAYRLMAICADERIRSHTNVLPPSWETLYALSKLSENKFYELLASGVIHPGMQRKDIKQAETAEKVERRNKREADLAAQVLAYANKTHSVFVEDFEWDQEVHSRETGMDRHAATHYETASDAHTAEEIHERTKERFATAAPDCVLFMWSTVQHLDIAMDLLRPPYRGFRYVSHYVWGKDKIALGYWNRNKHEVLLIGVRGNIPCPAQGTQWESFIEAAVRGHSVKPECFLEMIEQYFPNLPKIELNRRGPPRPGWDAWGNEVDVPSEAPNEARSG